MVKLKEKCHGAEVVRIVVEQGEARFCDLEFSGGTIYVGRHESCHVRLPGTEKISLRHLVLFNENGEWFVDPIHDQYHTSYLNGHLIRQKTQLSEGDVLRIEDFNIKLLGDKKNKSNAQGVPSLVKSRTNAELSETENYTACDLHLLETVIVKKRNETFSLGRGRLDYLRDLTQKLLDINDVREMIEIMNDILIKDFQVGISWVGLRTDAEGNMHLSSGKSRNGKAIDQPAAAKNFSYATVECGRALLQQIMEGDPECSCICVPIMSADGCLGMIYAETGHNSPRFTIPELDTFMFLANQYAIVIDRILRRRTEQLDKIRTLDHELARKIQSRTSPWQLPQWPGLSVAMLAEPGEDVCTDFHDVLPLGDEQAMMLIGEVPVGQTDSGVCLAEMSAGFRVGAIHRDAPQVLMRQINWLMFSLSPEPCSISAGIVSIDTQTGEFFLCLAGSVLAFLVSGSDKVVSIRGNGNPLIGQTRKAKFEGIKAKLLPGQSLVLCTSGIFSLTSEANERFHEDQLSDLLMDGFGQTTSRVLSEITDDISSYLNGRKPQRDLTLMMLRKSDV
jgi:serine phosphatase RsbU (regulator of sigma subunit)